ncbi:sensor histidine kinase [Piscinibacter sakaiensis]|uniref:histidine kinase n=1 Tax=Piscinibacter sakaiensis TaxID=1547922 RepID=A0A0K8P7W6_PISS1|nr:ATP-binding protein [Piscinibacter sakaiensis]GAP38721.1 osmosensitive K+ channel histidine kinase KdpD [Piscinibacter sakaiensis]
MPAPAPPEIAAPPAAGRAAALLRATGVVAACGGIAWLMQPWFGLSNLILVFSVGVVFVAATAGAAPLVWALLLSIVVIDFVFVPPRWGFRPIDLEHWEHYFTLAVMIALAVLVSGLSSRARRQARAAQRRASRLQRLNVLARALAAPGEDADVVRLAEAAVQDSLGRPARLVLDPAAPAPARALPLRDGQQRFGHLDLPGGHAPDAEAAGFLAAVAAQASLALARHASERRHAQALVEAEGERLRNTLLHGLSHDFRTPLTTLIGATSSLLEQGEQLAPPRRRQLLEGALREARRLDAITSTLLDLTRMEEGALQPRFEWCPADELMDEALTPLRPALAPFRLEERIDAGALVWCDPPLVARVLANLVDNAVRYTPPGGRIRIGLACRPARAAGTADGAAEGPGGCCEIEVADSGPGLPPGQEALVFRKFHRVQPDASVGSGLGLALCAAIARLHGGRIDARTDGGAVFTLRLPQPALEAAAIEA